MRLTLIVIVIGVVAGSFAAGAIWRDATLPAGRGAVPLARASATPIAAADTGAANGAAASPPAPGETAGAPAPGATTPIPSASPSVGAQAPAPPTDPAAFVAPVLAGPLPQRDPTLRSVANASTAWLSQSSSAPSLLRAPAGALVTDWRLNDPSQRAVRGYAGGVSVIPGDRIDLHLAGTDRTARLDIFRMGLGDAHHVETIRDVPVFA